MGKRFHVGWSMALLAHLAAAIAGHAASSDLGGLPIATVQTIALDPVNHGAIDAGVYSGPVGGGVFKSTDSGASWTLLNADSNFSTGVSAVVVDPMTPSTIYAGADYVGILKSTDGGATWNPASTGLGSLPSVESLAIDPGTPTTLYTTVVGGVYKTTNGGASWSAANAAGNWVAMNTGPTSLFVYALVVNPADPATLYACSRV